MSNKNIQNHFDVFTHGNGEMMKYGEWKANYEVKPIWIWMKWLMRPLGMGIWVLCGLYQVQSENVMKYEWYQGTRMENWWNVSDTKEKY